MSTVRWLVVVLVVVIACLGCFSGKKKGGGTNINADPSGSNDPYGRGGGPPALVDHSGR